MTIDRRTWGVAFALAALAGCATPQAERPTGSMTMPLIEGQVPIADIEGPFGAARYDENAVAIRIWPDSFDDGLAEFTVIVTNNTFEPILAAAATAS